MSLEAPSPAVMSPDKSEEVATTEVPVPSLFLAIKRQQIDKTGPLASLLQEPYSSPGQVSRSRKAGLRFSPKSRTRPASAPTVNARSRLNTQTLGRRVALAHLPNYGYPILNQNGFPAGPITQSPQQGSSSSSPPRVCGKSLPPRLQNLAAASGNFGSDPRMKAFSYPFVPPGLSLPPGMSSTRSFSQAAQSVNLFKQGSLSNQQYHTVAIPLDVFTQQIAQRVPGSISFPPVRPVAKEARTPQSPQTPTPFKTKASEGSSPIRKQSNAPKPFDTAGTSTRPPLASVSSNVPGSSRTRQPAASNRIKDGQAWSVALRGKPKVKPGQATKVHDQRRPDARRQMAQDPSRPASKASEDKPKKTNANGASRRIRGKRGKENRDPAAQAKVTVVASAA
ncbi:hypothetical protein EUX98_g2238 [Antrodiella citrinella]|uniref:Uncharacterized protein n=1 Tax=Antrodiella citrinella TaxID=2447956 RepID=A0A4S4MZK0_9APHY|nr:hypothetical protein EUX98_g2238 [Antrodiella citrinella]